MNAAPNTGLHCEIYGKADGDPILALHGLGSSTYTWRKLNDYPTPVSRLQIDPGGPERCREITKTSRQTSIPSINQAESIYRFIQEHDLKKPDFDGQFIWRRSSRS